MWNILFQIGKVIISNFVVEKVVTWIKENIFNISETPSYKPQEASIKETRKVNELLEKCIREYGEEAKKFDKIAIQIIKNQLIKITTQLEEFQDIISEHIFDMFINESKSIQNELKNIYSKFISESFSLNNNELLSILELNSGEEKKSRLEKLASKTLDNANEDLLEKLDNFLKKQQNFITKELKKYLDNILIEQKKSITETENIQKIINNEKNKKDEEKLKYLILKEKIKEFEKILK